MLLDSAFGDLWMPLSVFIVLAVTLGIGLSRLLTCAASLGQARSHSVVFEWQIISRTDDTLSTQLASGQQFVLLGDGPLPHDHRCPPRLHTCPLC